jgi:hypothetical protein
MSESTVTISTKPSLSPEEKQKLWDSLPDEIIIEDKDPRPPRFTRKQWLEKIEKENAEKETTKTENTNTEGNAPK